MKKRLLSMILAATMVLSSSVLVSASEEVILDEQGIESVDLIEGEESAVIIEEDVIVDDIEVEETGFDYQELVDGYNVKLSAAAGVLPEDVAVSINKLSESEESDVASLIEGAAQLAEGDAIAKTVTFDITFTDVDGNVVEPENGAVNVAVDVADDFTAGVKEAASADGVSSVEVLVYHVDEDNSVELVNNVPAETVVAEEGIAFNAADFSMYSIIILTHMPADTTKPDISSITIKNSKYTKGESKKAPKIIMDVYDDDSGIKEVEVRFTNAKDSNVFFNVSLKPNDDDMYEATIDVNDLAVSGKYEITNIAVGDNAGNYRLYTEVDLLFHEDLRKSFTVSNNVMSKLFKPTIKSIKFSSSNIKLDSKSQKFNIEIGIEDKTKTLYYGQATFVFKPAKGGKETVFTRPLGQKSKNGSSYVLATLPEEISYKNYTSGKLTLEAVTLKSIYNETYDYSVGADNLKKTVCTIVGYDLDGPKCTGLMFDNDKVDITSGSKSINLTAKVSDKQSGVDSIDIIFTNGTQTIIVDNFKKLDSNNFRAKVKLSAQLPEGNYEVGIVNLYDKAGNSTQYNSKNMPAELKICNLVVINMMTYNIAFDANGGKGKMPIMKNVSGSDAVRLKENKFTKKGYKFDSWNTEADGSGKKYHNKAEVKRLTNKDGATVTLYAQWKPIVYNIKFDANGGKGTMSTKKNCKYDKSYKLPANKYTRSGYKFVGWNTKKNGKGKSYDDLTKVKNLSTKNKATVTLYAIWKKK